MQDPIRVLIVDDSALMRTMVSRILEEAPDMEVVGTAMHGGFALEKIPRLDPDVIVLDLEMPKVDGLAFLRERRERGIDIPVIILSSRAKRGARITMEALSLGASDFITKPSGAISPDVHLVADTLREMIRGYGRRYRLLKGPARERGGKRDLPPAANERPAGPVLQSPGRSAPVLPPQVVLPPRRVVPLRRPGVPEVVAIGVSTGGPSALRSLLGALGEGFPLPLLIVQHMPPGFTKEFAESLNRMCALTVKEAEEGDEVRRGMVFIAPGDFHMMVEEEGGRKVVRLLDAPPVNGHRPSVDVLFESVARVYGNRSIAVIMTGMGRDGARMLGEVFRQGGITIGQDEETCVVYGMPRAAHEMGVLHLQLPLGEIPLVLEKLARQSASSGGDVSDSSSSS
ncbi:protein-glutamate methylesterase/protein-glutamine glutaminase [Spirochaeta thermophila]|uniref:Protein-glutamate methylesterase/protein-glutamine glutaminase n=1 Tax=Winmispira thermophila (strain ATCC 49972 / DSM 6192 / RI 19.B1) TaxID=665571 RepID=E0RRL2_WINT6|nr:chemotaxis response regulator protein-glutamate methylesterase [Spirochaeta thermophila]ADN03116.1 transcriptional regulatory protein [Spirochaeta thermophila DSM 6192]